jgi:hypothetical protein
MRVAQGWMTDTHLIDMGKTRAGEPGPPVPGAARPLLASAAQAPAVPGGLAPAATSIGT